MKKPIAPRSGFLDGDLLDETDLMEAGERVRFPNRQSRTDYVVVNRGSYHGTDNEDKKWVVFRPDISGR